MAKKSLGIEGYSTVRDVVNIQDNLMDALTGNKYSDQHSKELAARIVSEEIEALEKLRKKYFDLEQDMYMKMGLSENGLKTLYQKLNEWNSSGADLLLTNSNKVIGKLSELYVPFTEEELIELFNNYIVKNPQLIQEIFRDELNEIYGDEIPQILEESASLGTKRAGTGQFLALTFRTSKKASRRYIQGGKSNLNKGINILISGLNSNKVRISLTADMSSDVKKKLMSAISAALKSDPNFQNSNYAQRINGAEKTLTNLIQSTLPKKAKVSSKLRKHIKQIAQTYIVEENKIAVSSNRNVLTGMFGELYWTAFFDYIGVNPIPIGTSNVNVDILLGGYGAQVKHYKTEKRGANDIVVFHRRPTRNGDITTLAPVKETLGNFFSKELKQPQLAQPCGELLFSYVYNEVVDEKEVGKRRYRSFAPTIEKYIPVYNRFPTIISNIHTYVEANAAALLNISEFNLQPAQYSGNRINGPTLYLINSQLIPASTILESIINDLKNINSNNGRLVSIRVEHFDFIYNTFRDKKHWPNKPETDPDSYISTVRVQYTLEVDLTALMNAINNLIGG